MSRGSSVTGRSNLTELVLLVVLAAGRLLVQSGLTLPSSTYSVGPSATDMSSQYSRSPGPFRYMFHPSIPSGTRGSGMVIVFVEVPVGTTIVERLGAVVNPPASW